MPDRVGKGFADYLKEPLHTLHGIYGDVWPLETEAQAQILSDATLAPLGVVIGFWNKTLAKLLMKAKLRVQLPVPRVLYGWESAEQGTLTPVGDQLAARTLSFTLNGLTRLWYRQAEATARRSVRRRHADPTRSSDGWTSACCGCRASMAGPACSSRRVDRRRSVCRWTTTGSSAPS